MFQLFELPLSLTATIASALLSVVPLVPVFVVFLPPVIVFWLQVRTGCRWVRHYPAFSLVWTQDEFGTALLLGVAGVWLWWGAAAESIYSDIPNSPHPYLTGLSVIGVGCCRSCAMAVCVSVRR